MEHKLEEIDHVLEVPARQYVVRAERFDCRVAVSLMFANIETPGTVVNISATGLSVNLTGYVSLKVDMPVSISCRELGIVNGIVRWATHPRFGLQMTPASQASPRVRDFIVYLKSQSPAY